MTRVLVQQGVIYPVSHRSLRRNCTYVRCNVKVVEQKTAMHAALWYLYPTCTVHPARYGSTQKPQAQLHLDPTCNSTQSVLLLLSTTSASLVVC